MTLGAHGLYSKEPVKADVSSIHPSLAYAWEYRLQGFSEEDYCRALQSLVADFERVSGRKLSPGAQHRVGIKVDTAAGAGFSTPVALTRAVIAFLKSRGYSDEDIFIIDLSTEKLRDAGYLPPLSDKGDRFDGRIPIYALDTGEYYDKRWYYESPLPSDKRWLPTSFDWKETLHVLQQERRSYLPMPLLFGLDFWINLPMVSDDPALGVKGAIANASIWNVSNQRRFLDNPANAPVSAAEIAAIPELRGTWVFTLMSLEKFQYVGGPIYNAYYVVQEPRIWLSSNPVVLDYVALQKINRYRRAKRFPMIEPLPILFDSAEEVGLGDYGNVHWLLSRPKKSNGS